ncbi:nicotinate-nucleotide adenylyltransferase [Puia sp. P3]|uniref:nicotinate-nucleotide adenylyltransferase n=1 Tax=Puia sp. P3 TaxID=3423952 RepID=UPI003D676A21
MRPSKFMVLAGVFAICHAVPAFSQETLPEVTVTAANYKYLKSVNGQDVAVPVKRLQRMAASYDIRNSDIYEEDYDTYFISFYLPEGEILAAYDKDGKLLRTAEKYKNVKLPAAVSKAVITKFPNWSITKDVYLVNYFDDGGAKVKKYKLVLQNGTKQVRVQVNEDGEIS